MNILGIETTSSVCGCALVKNSDLIAIDEVDEPHVHDLSLAQSVAAVLRMADMQIGQIDVVAVSSGPGSFTGTRIGVSFAKGLTLTRHPQLLGISTMESLASAYSVTAAGQLPITITCMLGSHGNRCFLQRFRLQAPYHWSSITDIELRPMSDAFSFADPDDVLLSPNVNHSINIINIERMKLSAAHIALCALEVIKQKRKQFDDPLTFEPSYRQEFK